MTVNDLTIGTEMRYVTYRAEMHGKRKRSFMTQHFSRITAIEEVSATQVKVFYADGSASGPYHKSIIMSSMLASAECSKRLRHLDGVEYEVGN
jgi:5,10-methylenetetrahydrofolate reductase